VVPTRRSNCLQSTYFHASPQDNATGQTHFSFREHYLPRSPDLSSSGATLQARYTKHVLPILLTSNNKFWGIFKGSLRECYRVLWQPFNRDCSSVLNNMVVTYKVSYSNYDSYKFSWTWNASASVNKYFHFALKFIAIQKPSGVFAHPVLAVTIHIFLYTPGRISI